jgi:flagellar basal body P-ring formation protein FlgA
MTKPSIRVVAVLAVLATAFLPASAPPAAAQVETAASIRAAIDANLQSRLAEMKDASAEIGAIDARLRLPSCPALDVALPPAGTAAMTVKVECPSPNWAIYVPVRLHAYVEAVTASTNLAPNTKLTTNELSRGRVDAFSSNGGLVTETAQAEGKILKVGVVAGTPILASFLQQPLVVRRGEKVLMTLTDGDMVVRSTALAMEDGRVGDSIEVKNASSQKIVRATVAEDGTVEINF